MSDGLLSRTRWRHRRGVLLATLLVTACLTPTDAGDRFGELRIQPAFSDGRDPASLELAPDSLRTLIRRVGAGTAEVDTLLAYVHPAAHAWLLELEGIADEMEVTLELSAQGAVLYRGSRVLTASEGSVGRTELEDVGMEYVGATLASRIEVEPSSMAFSSLGAAGQLRATAFDEQGNELPGRTIRWSSADPAVAAVDGDGVVTASGTGATEVHAAADGVRGVATITVDTTLILDARIEADSASIAADGAATSLVTVTVRDANGNPVGTGGATVALTSSLGSITSPATDQGDGTYTATFTAGLESGTAVITGTLDGAAIGDSAQITLRPLAPSAGSTTITADSASLAADGAATSLVTVTVRDANGNPVGTGGAVVALTSSLGSIASPATDQGDGTYTATFTAGLESGAAVITGTLDGAAIGDSAQIALRPLAPSAGSTTITADSSSIAANGISHSLITVELRDSNGNPVGHGGDTVMLATSLGVLSELHDHGDGTYTATLRADTTTAAGGTGAVADTAIVAGTLNGAAVEDTARIEFRHEPGDVLTTTITADSASLAPASRTLVRVVVRDAAGERVFRSAGTVVLSTTAGILSAVIDNGDGTYTAELKATGGPAVAVITGTLNDVAIRDREEVQLLK